MSFSNIMDPIDMAHNTKMQKLNFNEEQNANDGRNVIDKLPREIIGRILSFLPMKEAVKTSILSKKWQWAWMSVSNLDLQDGYPYQRTLFINFVERVLALRDASDIQKFSLSFSARYDDDASRINTWVSAAIKHNVQKLSLELYGLEDFCMPFELPSSVFDRQSLKELDLSVSCELKLPSAISLPSLKKLDVSQVTFLDDLSVMRLFSGCPNIRSLSLNECDWKNVKGVVISFPMLESLFIFENCMEEPKYNSGICNFVISGTNLKRLNLAGRMENDYCLCSSSSLVEADINVIPSEESGRLRDNAYRLYKLLRGLSDVKTLELTPDALELLSYAEELLPHMPTFQRLTHLQFYDLSGEGFDQLTCREIGQSIVRNSPLLDYSNFEAWFC